MKRILLGLICATIFSQQALAQSAVIRGEVSPGVYETIKTDGLQNLSVNTNAGTRGLTYTTTFGTLGTSNATASAANTNRKYVLIQNNHASQNVFVGFGSLASTNFGVKLAPGQSYTAGPGAVSTQSIIWVADGAGTGPVLLILGE